MIDLYIRNSHFQKRNDISVQNNARIAVSDPFLRAQFQIIRGDCEWLDLDYKEAIKGIENETLDGIVLSKEAKEYPENDELRKLEVPTNLVMVQESNSELRFQHSSYEKEEIEQIEKIEKDIKEALIKKFPKAQVGVLAELGNDYEGHKKNQVQLAFLNSKMESPYLLKFSSADPEKLIQRACDKVEKIKAKRIFISREIKENDGLNKGLLSNGYRLEGKTLVEHKVIPIKRLPKSEWIFFSNRRAVQYFFVQSPEIGKRKIGCISKQVADELRKYKHRADFIGGSDSKMVGRQFHNITGNAVVLFPKGKQDMRSVQQTNYRGNTIDLEVYETSNHGEYKIPAADILIFTSPANVMTFLESNSITSQKVIAYGDATFQTLKAKGIHGIYPVHSFDNIGLARSIYGASVG